MAEMSFWGSFNYTVCCHWLACVIQTPLVKQFWNNLCFPPLPFPPGYGRRPFWPVIDTIQCQELRFYFTDNFFMTTTSCIPPQFHGWKASLVLNVVILQFSSPLVHMVFHWLVQANSLLGLWEPMFDIIHVNITTFFMASLGSLGSTLAREEQRKT